MSVLYSVPRILTSKALLGKGFKSELVQRISPDVVLEFQRGSRVTLGKRLSIHSHSKFKVRKGAELSIGDRVFFNYSCIAVVRKRVTIGAGTAFGPSVYIFDHDHDLKAGPHSSIYKTAPVEIGENCWIGANTVILRGTKLGKNCVVGAGSVLSGVYPDNSVIVQKRDTEVRNYQVVAASSSMVV